MKFEKEKWQRSLDEAVEELLVKGNLKAPINVIQVGFLDKDIAKQSSILLGVEVESGGIILTKDRLIHAKPQRKELYKHAFRVEEMKKIVEILADKNNSYVDIREGKRNIVFVFGDEQDETKANLIPIEILRSHKKIQQKNYILTLDKVDKREFAKNMKGGFVKKIK